MAYTFAVNTEKIEGLINKLNQAKTDISDGIPKIFNTIDEMDDNEYWGGDSYTEFATGAGRYKEALETLPKVIEAFETQLTKLNTEAQATIDKICQAIQSMNND